MRLFAAVPDLLLRVSDNGALLGVQRPQAFGLPGASEAAPGSRLEDALPPEVAGPARARLAEVCAGTPLLFDVRRDDRVWEVRMVPAPPQEALLLVRDVTDSRGDTERLRLAAALFENTSEGVLVADAGWKIIAVNEAFSRITGYGRCEVLGRNANSFLRSGRDPAFQSTLEDVLAQQGSWQGEVWSRRKSGEVYPQWLNIIAKRDASGSITHYVESFSDLSDRGRLEDRLAYLAHYDALTNLPNRVLAQDRLERALAWADRRGQRVAVMCLDIDRFRAMNEERGQALGDHLLREVADRLRRLASRTDTVARFGGDEFLLVEEALRDVDHARRIAMRVLDALEPPYLIDGEEHRLSASLGISIYPEDATDVPSLVQNAVAAVGSARGRGGNGYAFFSAEATVQAHEQHRLEEDLRAALGRGEFVLHYQPKVDLQTGEIQGTEALVRWRRHANGALIRPDRFIPLAERTGLIVPIGEWVLEEACRQTALWQSTGHPELDVAVNLSPAQLWDPDLPAKVRRALERSGLAPCYLELEITESLVVEDPERAAKILGELKQLGVSFSIDDFGTGYSSLGLLRRLPVDTVKIDKSFVDDIPHQADAIAIVHAIISMGHSLGMRVIAEGVETEEQMRVLQQHDCDLLQGYHFSRPLSTHDLEHFLNAPPPVSVV
ncbi:MAG: bifunctional diguanylate cyclase/phosphodiesterase [Planctomycetota bacterium]|nr:MAG: bifunctional diguanylate cyclase/phosphodiesterase [Planctomycetota bacterium]